MDWIELWKSALLKPEEAFAAAKGKADLVEGVKMVGVASLVYGVLAGFAAFFFLSRGAFGGALVAGSALSALGFVASAVVVSVVTSIVGFVVACFVVDKTAVFLKGKGGSFDVVAYVFALFCAPIMVVGGVFSLVPVVGNLLVFLLCLYGFYLALLALKEVYGFNWVNAVIALVVSGIASLVVVAVLDLVFALFGIRFGVLPGLGGFSGAGGPGNAFWRA